jgi:hypothetical protein
MFYNNDGNRDSYGLQAWVLLPAGTSIHSSLRVAVQTHLRPTKKNVKLNSVA